MRPCARGDRGQGLTVNGPLVRPGRCARFIRRLEVHDQMVCQALNPADMANRIEYLPLA
jgi:hypothetical protein